MKLKKNIAIFCTAQLVLIFIHLYQKNSLMQLMHKTQALATQKQALGQQKNELQLAYEQLKNPIILATQAHKNNMQKLRLNKLTTNAIGT